MVGMMMVFVQDKLLFFNGQDIGICLAVYLAVDVLNKDNVFLGFVSCKEEKAC